MPLEDAEQLATQEGAEVRSWISTCLELAADHETGVPVGELADLLPSYGRMSASDLHGWLARRPDLAELHEGWAFAPGRASGAYRDLRARANRYAEEARGLIEGPLRGTLPWLHCLGITGSTAYGSADASDDLDFLVVARDGFLWLALLRIYLSLRLRRPEPGEAAPPRLCFNFVRDDASVRREFARTGDRLFAREALTARILVGDRYYADLLGSAPWIGEHLPIAYARRRASGERRDRPGARAPRMVRAANLAAFVGLALYLQLVGLLRNARLRRDDRPECVFRTLTTLGGLSYDSIRFERIRARYPGPTRPTRRPAAIGHGSAAAGARPRPRSE